MLSYRVELDHAERTALGALLNGGKRAQILLAADAGLGDEAIVAAVGASGSTVYRTKRRFVELGLEAGHSARSRALGPSAR